MLFVSLNQVVRKVEKIWVFFPFFFLHIAVYTIVVAQYNDLISKFRGVLFCPHKNKLAYDLWLVCNAEPLFRCSCCRLHAWNQVMDGNMRTYNNIFFKIVWVSSVSTLQVNVVITDALEQNIDDLLCSPPPPSSSKMTSCTCWPWTNCGRSGKLLFLWTGSS